MSASPKNFRIDVAADGKKAWLITEGGAPIPVEAIKRELTDSGVHKGINEDLVKKAAEGHKLLRSEPIAQYILPEDGKPAKLEYLIEHDVKPLLREDGTLNFREINLILNVKENQPLLRKSQPEMGKPGYLVNGKEIPGEMGKDLDLKDYMGKGCKMPEKNPNLILAAIDGAYKKTRAGKVSVLNIYQVDGNVDYATGNIHSSSSVIVDGDVESGFLIECEGDVAVKGLVENANIAVKGDLNIKLGITQGSEPIIVAGTLNAMYIYNRPAVQAGDVDIREMISFSSLIVKGKLTAKRVVGGEIIARDDILVEIAGSDRHESKTILNAGIDIEKRKKRDSVKAQLKSLEEKWECLNDELDELNYWIVEYDKKSDEMARRIAEIESSFVSKKLKDSIQSKLSRLNQIKNEMKELKKQIDQQKKQLATPSQELANPKARVIVSGTVFAGVIVTIGESIPFVVKKTLNRIVFYLDKEGQVATSSMV